MAHAVRDMDPQSVVADMTPGNHGLRRQIALRYMVGGLLLPVEELVISNGALEALNLCLQVVTRPGDLVAIEAPAFYATLQVLERLKLKAVEIPVHPREGIDLEVLADSLERLPIKACWFMSNFQNPMGASMDDEKKRALAEPAGAPPGADDRGRRVRRTVLRPAGAETGQGLRPGRPGDALQFLLQEPGAGLPGRLGGRRTLRRADRATEADDQPVGVDPGPGGHRRLSPARRLRPPPAQAALRPGDPAERHARGGGALLPEQTRVSRPSGGYFLWLELPEAVDSLRLFQLALAQGISLAPGPIFSATRRFAHCARLNYGHPWSARQEKAMETLGRIAQSLAG